MGRRRKQQQLGDVETVPSEPVRWTASRAAKEWGVSHKSVLNWIKSRMEEGRDYVREFEPLAGKYIFFILNPVKPLPSVAPIPFIPRGPRPVAVEDGAGADDVIDDAGVEPAEEAPTLEERAAPRERREPRRRKKERLLMEDDAGNISPVDSVGIDSEPAAEPELDEYGDVPAPESIPEEVQIGNDIVAWASARFPNLNLDENAEEGVPLLDIGRALLIEVAPILGTDVNGVARKDQLDIERAMIKLLRTEPLTVEAKNEVISRFLGYLAKYKHLALRPSHYWNPANPVRLGFFDVPPVDDVPIW